MKIAGLAASLFSRLTLLTCIKSRAFVKVQHLHGRTGRERHCVEWQPGLRARKVCRDAGCYVVRTEAMFFLSFTRRRLHGAPRRDSHA